MIAIVTAGIQARAPWTENATTKTSFTKPEVTTSTSRETYIGLCDTTFKLRDRNHACSFRNERYKHAGN